VKVKKEAEIIKLKKYRLYKYQRGLPAKVGPVDDLTP
jgi:hypothetical protein